MSGRSRRVGAGYAASGSVSLLDGTGTKTGSKAIGKLAVQRAARASRPAGVQDGGRPERIVLPVPVARRDPPPVEARGVRCR